ncbi:hypothetical protein PINS_up023366 [Pythium insidiosum]|nr:hypothetical protein PINS_up023366 [Pythium insidiosum]
MSNALATEAATSEVQDPRTERRHDDNDSDDGFDDFLSEEEEESTLQTQEMDALARKMKSVGLREAIEWGKEATLQQGFDEGFAQGARDVFRLSRLRGALSVAEVSGFVASRLSDEERTRLQRCVTALRQRSQRIRTQEDDDSALEEEAHEWLRRLEIPLPSEHQPVSSSQASGETATAAAN